MRIVSVLAISALLLACSNSNGPHHHNLPATPASRAADLIPGINTMPSGVQEFSLSSDGKTLKVYALNDDLIYFSYFTTNPVPAFDDLFSEMIADKSFHGATSLSTAGQTFTTARLKITLNNSLCVAVDDLTGHRLNTTCPNLINNNRFILNITAPDTTQAYGLGEQFFNEGSNGDWLGRVRLPGITTGNRMVNFLGGQVGNLQIPVLLTYQKSQAVGYFLDSPHAQTWDLRESPWIINAFTNHFGVFIFAKDSFSAIRQQYMQLTGTPPVPPKTAFGLWVSEYGFDNWAEADSKIIAQHSANMPLDGLMLDLQWFGGIAQHMGSLIWDTKAFPDPAVHLKMWKDTWGVNAVTIEEPYVDTHLGEYAGLEHLGYLVRRCEGCPGAFSDDWWGSGGMLDWTNKEGASYWHKTKRTPLIDAGIVGHWIDLGEPESFDPGSWYADTYKNERHTQAGAHNLYNFYWSKSIFDGYRAEQPTQRPWTLSRSGTAGSQRFGATFWSGDIGTNSASLAAQQQVQMHLSMSGYDYFGSDAGGFHRGSIGGKEFDDLYTIWFANSALFDIPLRVHTENLCNCKQSAPALAGDVPSNRFNVQLRYRLFPYYYSLAHQAYRTGSAIFPPLAYFNPQDKNAIGVGNIKYIGASLLARTYADPGEAPHLPSYIPPGTWLDWHNQTWLISRGQEFDLNGVYSGITTLPLLAKEGAIIPMMHVDDKTMNLKGQRTDKSTRNDLLVRVVASINPSEFTLYEDDGQSMAYQTGAVAETLISQQTSAGEYRVTIAPTTGSYAKMANRRAYEVELFAMNAKINKVYLGNQLLPIASSRHAYDTFSRGAYHVDGSHWLAKTTPLAVAIDKSFRFVE